MNKITFVESLKINDGQYCNLPLHQDRIVCTASHFYGRIPVFDPENHPLPETLRKGVVKCRVIYSDRIEAVEFHPYIYRKLHTIRLVEDDEIDYSFKYENRENLKLLSELKGDAGDILIVKNGLITDTSFSNVVFENKEGFFTPDTYLLNGLKRRELLEKGKIKETMIRVEDIYKYHSIWFINAMLELEDRVGVGVKSIK